MTPDDGKASGSVAIGGFTLQVGGAGGTVIQQSTQPAAEGTGTLARALEEPEAKEKSAAVETAEKVEDASGVTAKCERAVSLSKGVAEGKALDPEQLGAEVGALLDLLERLDRKSRHKDALKIARALATLLMLLRRWAALLRTLRTALGVAEKLGDLDAIGWAKHELGTLRLAAGDIEGAGRDLHEAREIRERIGDRRGLATTNRNLGALCERLQQMLREEELVRRRPRGPRPTVLWVLALAVLFALAFAAGVLAGNGGNSGKPAGFENGGPHPTGPTGTSGVSGPSGTTGPTGSTGPTGKKSDGGAESSLLTVEINGVEGGEVVGEGGECLAFCKSEVTTGTELTVEAVPFKGYVFEGFSGACDTTAATCTFTMTEDLTLAATFAPEPTANPDGEPTGTTTSEESTEEEPLKKPEEEGEGEPSSPR